MGQVPVILRGEIHLGDLARALETLGCKSRDHRQFVASCLGFSIERPSTPEAQLKSPRTPEAQREIYNTHLFPDRPKSQPRPSGKSQGFTAPPQPDLPVSLPNSMVQSALEELEIRTPPTPDEIPEPDDDYEILGLEGDLSPLARSTLFTENTSRGLFSAALSTLRPGNEIDVPRLIESTVRFERLARLTRLPTATLASGCQLLLDYRSTMTPFFDDLASLPGQIAQITPADQIATFSFDTDPSSAQCWTRDLKRQPWRPDKRPVLVATDFGIQGRGGRAATPEDWPRFIDRCRVDGSPLLLLIPWPRDRWPTGLGGYPELIHWSPLTTAAIIRRKIGLGHKIPR